MKNFINKFWLAVLLVTFFSCEQEDHRLTELQGTVSFGGISLEFEPIGSPGSRISGNFPWVHVFPNSGDLFFTNKATGQEYVLEYNPNDFSTTYSIALPYGAYEYYSIVEGGIFSAFLPFKSSGEFSLVSQSLEISIESTTEYGLVTVKDQYLEKASISDRGEESDLKKLLDGNYWYMYVKGGTSAKLNIEEAYQGSTISRELDIEANRHYNFVLKLNDGTASITNLILAVFELEEEEILLASGSKFFEENGTIKCPGATPGEMGRVNDKVYEAVDRNLLIQRIDEGASLSCLCTSLVSDMHWLFFEADPGGGSNQPIENWDVSNVTNMHGMFLLSNFNQPVGNWDVSKVTDMSYMFAGAEDFDQPIGNWDVSKVTNMREMFASTGPDYEVPVKFNQSIGEWNVGNVTNMYGMFRDAIHFNQPIGNWDVSKVMNVREMFYEALMFNQDLSNWCLQNIPSEPSDFSVGSALIDTNKPVWGTCPE